MPNQSISNKKIAIILAFREFRDIEYFIPRNILSAAGAQITNCSTEKGTAVGADGGDVRVNLAAPDLKVQEFDAVVFIGGPGMAKNLDNEDFQRIAKETVKENKILAAICIAPALLAKAGVLKDKKATVWTAPLDKSAVKILKENGAEYQDKDVVVDSNVITASGPAAAANFGETLVRVLTEKRE